MKILTTKLRRRQIDEMSSKLRGIVRPNRGYIREIRDALEMSSYQLADRIGVRQSTIMDMEESERQGTITLRSLERAAAALGCKLIYGLVPETTLESVVQEQAHLRARELTSSVFRTMALEQQATTPDEHERIEDELAEEILRKGKRELWKHDKQ